MHLFIKTAVNTACHKGTFEMSAPVKNQRKVTVEVYAWKLSWVTFNVLLKVFFHFKHSSTIKRAEMDTAKSAQFIYIFIYLQVVVTNTIPFLQRNNLPSYNVLHIFVRTATEIHICFFLENIFCIIKKWRCRKKFWLLIRVKKIFWSEI